VLLVHSHIEVDLWRVCWIPAPSSDLVANSDDAIAPLPVFASQRRDFARDEL
jgi:hypothetical protein